MTRQTATRLRWLVALLALPYGLCSEEAADAGATSDAPKIRRDTGKCRIKMPSRLQNEQQRSLLFGEGDATTHADTINFLKQQDWGQNEQSDIHVKVPPLAKRDHYMWLQKVHSVLNTTGFAVVSPTLSQPVADKLRKYVFSQVKQYSHYYSPDGCLDVDHNHHFWTCKEYWDMPLRLSPAVTAAANQWVASAKSIIAQEIGPNAELVELSAVMTCAGSPEQRWQSKGEEILGSKIFSSLTALQDTSLKHGPVQALWPTDWLQPLEDVMWENSEPVITDAAPEAAPTEEGEEGSIENQRHERKIAKKNAFNDFLADPDNLHVDHQSSMLYVRVPWEEDEDGSGLGKRYNVGLSVPMQQGTSFVFNTASGHRAGPNQVGARVFFRMSFQSAGSNTLEQTFNIPGRYLEIVNFTQPQTPGEVQYRIRGKIALSDFPLEADTVSTDFSFAVEDAGSRHLIRKRLHAQKLGHSAIGHSIRANAAAIKARREAMAFRKRVKREL